MKETEPLNLDQKSSAPQPPPHSGRRRCLLTTLIIIAVLLVTLIAIALILSFTLFKPKEPQTRLLSVSVDGVAPRVTLPSVQIQLNISISLNISVYNPNRASFKHAQGQSQVFYRDRQVGELEVLPGRIPARGSETVNCVLVLEIEKFATEISNLIGDVAAGEISIDVKTRIPGRITFLGIFKRHAVALSECRVAFGVRDLKIRRQECSRKTKL